MEKLLVDFAGLSTALIFDASVRLGVSVRAAEPGIRALTTKSRVAGRALPARHYGSVDVFLEAINASRRGDVLVIDNGGRKDEACIGDLVTLESKAAGLSGIVVWGCHRDSEDLRRINLPIFSFGPYSFAPTRVGRRPKDALSSARFGDFRVGRNDVVFADGDGVLFLPNKNMREIVRTAREIAKTERLQAARVKAGKTLRDQFEFGKYLAKRRKDSSYTFRKHLREIGGAVEE